MSFAQLPSIPLPRHMTGVIKASITPLSCHAPRPTPTNRVPAQHLADVDNQPVVVDRWLDRWRPWRECSQLGLLTGTEPCRSSWFMFDVAWWLMSLGKVLPARRPRSPTLQESASLSSAITDGKEDNTDGKDLCRLPPVGKVSASAYDGIGPSLPSAPTKRTAKLFAVIFPLEQSAKLLRRQPTRIASVRG